MATVSFKSGSEYMIRLQKLSQKASEEVCGRAIYEGAAVMTEAVKKEIDGLRTDSGIGTEEKPLKGPTKAQVEGLKKSIGIARARDDGGFINVKIGFDGYNDTKTKKYPQGQPNQLVARGVERGTSWLEAQPFMKKAVSNGKKEVIEAMEKGFDEKMKEIMEG